jgi:hypothetical protein
MRCVLLVSVICLGACGDDGSTTPPPPLCTGAWHVCGGHLRDATGRAAILRGMNVGKKESPYLDFHAAADFTRMRDDWGMNAVRFYFPWAAVEPSPGQYDDAFLDQVRQRLDWAAAAKVDVILDLHQDVYGEGFGFDGAPRWTCDQARYDAFVPAAQWPLNYLEPNVKACFDGLWNDPALGEAHAAVWRHIAGRLGDHPAVIGFDAINEPHWGSHDLFTFERERLQPFFDRDVAAVRAVAPRWVAFLEPAGSRNIGIPTSLQPFAYPDVVYAPHAYDSAAEQEQGFDEGRRAAFLDNVALLAHRGRGARHRAVDRRVRRPGYRPRHRAVHGRGLRRGQRRRRVEHVLGVQQGRRLLAARRRRRRDRAAGRRDRAAVPGAHRRRPDRLDPRRGRTHADRALPPRPARRDADRDRRAAAGVGGADRDLRRLRERAAGRHAGDHRAARGRRRRRGDAGPRAAGAVRQRRAARG